MRAGWALRAIYVNSPAEVYYPSAIFDNDGNTLNGTNNYKIHFEKESLPPVKYFWSLTMYDAKNLLMVEKPINKYSIGDRTEGLKYNEDGSLTLYLGNKEPVSGKSNWLPGPNLK